MPSFEPQDPHYEKRVRASFAQQAMMETLGAQLEVVRPGEVEIVLPLQGGYTQQHGYLHAAAVTAIADSACGYAALTLMSLEREVLSIEFKVNLLAPAASEAFRSRARVVRPGRTITVCNADVLSAGEAAPEQIVVVQATMMAVAK